MLPARLLVEELGSAYVQYSFVASWVFRCGARPAVNEIRQIDFLFLESSCGFGNCLPAGRNRFRLCEMPFGIGRSEIQNQRNLSQAVWKGL